MTALDTLATALDVGKLALEVGAKVLRALTTESVSEGERAALRRVMGNDLASRIAKVAADAKAREKLGG